MLPTTTYDHRSLCTLNKTMAQLSSANLPFIRQKNNPYVILHDTTLIPVSKFVLNILISCKSEISPWQG